jgi:hypothetical protein
MKPRYKNHLFATSSLVTNLCVSEMAMGIYLLMVGSADAHYKGESPLAVNAGVVVGYCHHLLFDCPCL